MSNLELKKAIKTVSKEVQDVMLDPPPGIENVSQDDHDMLHVYFLLRGPRKTLFAGGMFMGEIVFPEQYPMKPPLIRLITPNGRFIPNERICASFTNYHPESWMSSWTLATLLVAFLSFFLEVNTHTTGSYIPRLSDSEIKGYVEKSREWNERQPLYQKHFGQYGAGDESYRKTLKRWALKHGVHWDIAKRTTFKVSCRR